MERRLSHKKFFMIMGLSVLFTLAGVFTATAGGPLTMEQVKAELEKYKGSSLVITSWGGSYQDAQRKAYYEPFEKEFGIKIIEDSPAAISKVMAMVKAKKVTWDIVDGGAYKLDDLGGRGFLEKMDYNIIDAGDVDPFFVSEWYMSTISWCETRATGPMFFPATRPPPVPLISGM
jgi:putative spermidine/putrescine transport system substrate-binding protein